MPAPAEDAILDNTTVTGNYTVTLPAGAVITQVNKLTITPSAGHTITSRCRRRTPAPRVCASATAPRPPTTSCSTPAPCCATLRCRLGRRDRAAVGGERHAAHQQWRALRAQQRPHPGGGRGALDRRRHRGRRVRVRRPDRGDVRARSGRPQLRIPDPFAPSGTVSYTATGATPVAVRGDLRINTGVTLSSTMTAALNLSGSLVAGGAALTVPATQPVKLRRHRRPDGLGRRGQ